MPDCSIRVLQHLSHTCWQYTKNTVYHGIFMQTVSKVLTFKYTGGYAVMGIHCALKEARHQGLESIIKLCTRPAYSKLCEVLGYNNYSSSC